MLLQLGTDLDFFQPTPEAGWDGKACDLYLRCALFEPRTVNRLSVLSVFAALPGRPNKYQVTPRSLDAMHPLVHFTTTIRVSIEDVSLSIRQNRYKKRFIIIFSESTAQRGLWPPRFTRFLDHTQRRAIVGRTPLDEWSARSRDLYLTTDKHPCPGGIRTHDRSRRAAVEPTP
jgi:hypothetical protein